METPMNARREDANRPTGALFASLQRRSETLSAKRALGTRPPRHRADKAWPGSLHGSGELKSEQ